VVLRVVKPKNPSSTNKIDPRLPAQRSGSLQSIHRAISLLRVISKNNERGIRLSAICREIGLKTSTTHRLLSSLLAEEMITFDPFTKLYQLGFELHKLGGVAYQYSIAEYYHDVMERIARETEDTVFLSIRVGASCVCLKRMEGAYPVRIFTVEEGSRRPLGVGAGSLALLSELPDAQVDQVLHLNKALYRYYNNRTEQDIRRSIRMTRELGYAVHDRTFNDNVTAVGVPVFNQRGDAVAAIAVAAIPPRMDSDRREKVVKLIKSEINRVSVPEQARGVD
jgi:DNA-binding IclR family transcriptional regulator